MADMTPQKRKEALLATPVEDILETYRAGDITALTKNKLLREKATVTLEQTIADKGYLGAIFAQSVKNLQDGWDNLKESAIREPSGSVGTEAYYVGLAVWGQIQMLTSAMNAVGEVTGKVAETQALRSGASPGLAKTIGFAVDVGTGFVPVGLAAKSFAKGVQGIGAASKARTAAKASAGAAKAAAGAETEKVVQTVLAKGLEVDGVKDAAKILQKEPQMAPTIERFLEEATVETLPSGAKIVHGTRGSIKEVFAMEEIVAKKLDKDVIDLRRNAMQYVDQKFKDTLSSAELQAMHENFYYRFLKKASSEEAGSAPGVGRLASQTERAALGPAVDETGARIIRETEEAIARATPPSVAESFSADLKKFHDEIASLTEKQTHEATARMADKLNLSLEDLKGVVPGQALNERELYAYLKALEPRVAEWKGLAQRVVDAGTEEATNAFAKYTADLFTVAPKFRGAEVTAGRSVEILKEEPAMKKLTDMAMGWDPENMASGNFTGAVTTMAEDVLAMLTEKGKSAEALVAVGQSNWQRLKENGWPMIREAYTNLLLSRPSTQVKNFLGNSIAGANAIAERMAGGVFSADPKTGLIASEAFQLSKGMMLALGDGLSAFGRAFSKMGPEDAQKFDFMPGAIPGTLGRIIRTPGNALQGMDNFFKTLFRRGSYYAQATREGTQRGLGGDDLAAFVARRVNHPTESMLSEATDFALNQTFQNELGTIGKRMQQTLQAGPMALYFPFMKTPLNLAKYAWNRTPGLQLTSKSLYTDILEGGVKADMAIGRLTMSHLTAMFMFELAKDEIITGGGPVDPNLRRVWLTTHQPYSVKTKDGWVPMVGLEPATTTMGMVADFAQVLNQIDEPTAGQAAMALSFSVMKDLTDKTYWQGVTDLVDIAGGVSMGRLPSAARLGQTVFGPAATVMTGGPAVAAVARIEDPTKREVRSFLDNVISRVPGYSKTVPPDRDPYGDPILYPQAVGPDWLGVVSPITEKPFETDRVKLEGDKLQIKVPDFPWAIGGTSRDDFDIRAPMPEDKLAVGLENAQRDRWQQISKGLLRHPKHGIEATLLDTPQYQNAPRAMQRELFMDAMAGYRRMSQEALTVEDPGLFRKMMQNDAKHVLPMLQESQRPQAAQQYENSITGFERMAPQQRQNLLRWGVLNEPEDQP